MGIRLPMTACRETDRIALYLRVANSLRGRIADGEWRPATQLPIIKDLAKKYRVSLVTVRQALGILAGDGLVEGGQGRGTFVRETVRSVRDNPNLRAAINDRLALPPGTTIKILGRETTTDLPDDLAPDDVPRHPKYVCIRKLHLQDGEPFAVITVTVAQQIYRLFPKGADKTTKILRLLMDYGQLVLSRSRIELVVTYADSEMSTLLQCPVMAALVRIRSFRVDDTSHLAFGHVSYYRADRFIYEVEEHETDLEKSSPIILPATRRMADRKRS